MKKISLEKYFLALSRDSFIYGLGNAVLKVLALLTAPIFTRIFVPSEYGIISLVASVISFLSLFLIFGMDNAMFVEFFEYKKERKEVLSSAFWFLFSWGLLLMLLSSFFAASISELIFKTIAYKTLFLLAFSTAYFTLLVNFTKVVFRLEFRAKTFAVLAATNAILVTGLMIFFVVFLKKGLVGFFEGQLIGTLISAALGLYFVRRSLRFKLNFLRLKEMVFFGAMIVPASVSFFVFDLSDRFFLNHYRSLSELGLYSIAINIVGLIVFFSFAFGQAWSPQVTKIYFESKRIFHQFVPRFFIYYLIFFFLLATFLSLFGQEILKVFTTAKFYGAAKVIPSLSLAMVFSASNQITAMGITISRQTKFLAFYTMLAAVLNIVLNFLLIPKYGMVGAGWATAVSYLFLTLAYFGRSQKLVPIACDWPKILKLVILSLATILLAPLSWHFNLWQNMFIKILEFGGFVLLLYLFGIIEQQEIRYLKKYIKKIQISK